MLDNFIPFLLFVVAMTGTPGPGNLTMMAIGQATGFKSAMRFLIGMAIGWLFLNTLVACGLGTLIVNSPRTMMVLRITGCLYILYLAGKILLVQVKTKEIEKQFSFFEGLFIHPLSPKSWAMVVVAYSQFMKPDQALAPQIALFIFSFLAGMIVFHSSWCAAGALIPRFVQSKRFLLCINSFMVTLMIGATGYAMLM